MTRDSINHRRPTFCPYNQKADYVYFLAQYMFRQKCKAEDVDPFCKFIQIVATVDWSNTDFTDAQ